MKEYAALTNKAMLGFGHRLNNVRNKVQFLFYSIKAHIKPKKDSRIEFNRRISGNLSKVREDMSLLKSMIKAIKNETLSVLEGKLSKHFQDATERHETEILSQKQRHVLQQVIDKLQK